MPHKPHDFFSLFLQYTFLKNYTYTPSFLLLSSSHSQLLPSQFYPALLRLPKNQTTPPEPSSELRNLLSIIVEICHLGADVTSDLVGRRECKRRALEGKKGCVCCSTKVRQGGDRHGCHVQKGLPSSLTLSLSPRFTSVHILWLNPKSRHECH